MTYSPGSSKTIVAEKAPSPSVAGVRGGGRIDGSVGGRRVDQIVRARRVGIGATPVESEGVAGRDGRRAGIVGVGLADLRALRRLVLVGGRRRRRRCGRAEGA